MATEVKGKRATRRGGPPRKVGRRTTVRLTEQMNDEVTRLAAERGISENDAHLILLEVGVDEHRRRRELRELVERRRKLVDEMFGEYDEGDEMLSADELEAAIMAPDDFEDEDPEDD